MRKNAYPKTGFNLPETLLLIRFQTDMKNDSNPHYNWIRVVFERVPLEISVRNRVGKFSAPTRYEKS